MVKVKVCGITNVEDARWCANLGVDIVGMIFAKNSPRTVSLKNAREIAKSIPAFVKKAGVFLNQESKFVSKACAACGLDILQFHGQEAPQYCVDFMGKAEVIKAFRIKDESSLNALPEYRTNFYLLDTYVEGIPGGTGEGFSWDLAVRAKEFGVPIILSGGLNPENVKAAIKKVMPAIVDVASGVENSPRRKNPDLIKKFIEQVNKATIDI